MLLAFTQPKIDQECLLFSAVVESLSSWMWCLATVYAGGICKPIQRVNSRSGVLWCRALVQMPGLKGKSCPCADAIRASLGSHGTQLATVRLSASLACKRGILWFWDCRLHIDEFSSRTYQLTNRKFLYNSKSRGRENTQETINIYRKDGERNGGGKGEDKISLILKRTWVPNLHTLSAKSHFLDLLPQDFLNVVKT